MPDALTGGPRGADCVRRRARTYPAPPPGELARRPSVLPNPLLRRPHAAVSPAAPGDSSAGGGSDGDNDDVDGDPAGAAAGGGDALMDRRRWCISLARRARTCARAIMVVWSASGSSMSSSSLTSSAAGTQLERATRSSGTCANPGCAISSLRRARTAGRPRARVYTTRVARSVSWSRITCHQNRADRKVMEAGVVMASTTSVIHTLGGKPNTSRSTVSAAAVTSSPTLPSRPAYSAGMNAAEMSYSSVSYRRLTSAVPRIFSRSCRFASRTTLLASSAWCRSRASFSRSMVGGWCG